MVGVCMSRNGWGTDTTCYRRCPVNIWVPDRKVEGGGGIWYRRGTSLCVCVGERASACHQSTSLRSLTGSSCTMLRWFMARLKAIWTALRMLDVRPSIILILSMVLSIPRGTILDLGSHCLKRENKHWHYIIWTASKIECFPIILKVLLYRNASLSSQKNCHFSP